MITRDYCEQFYTNRLDNPEEMDKFLETYNPPRPNHEEMENLNRPIMSKEIESVIQNLPKMKGPEPDGSHSECYQTFKQFIPTLLKGLQKIEERTFPNSFYKVSITLIPKPEKDTIGKENIGQHS